MGFIPKDYVPDPDYTPPKFDRRPPFEIAKDFFGNNITIGDRVDIICGTYINSSATIMEIRSFEFYKIDNNNGSRIKIDNIHDIIVAILNIENEGIRLETTNCLRKHIIAKYLC